MSQEISDGTVFIINGRDLKALLDLAARSPYGTWDESEWNLAASLLEEMEGEEESE